MYNLKSKKDKKVYKKTTCICIFSMFIYSYMFLTPVFKLKAKINYKNTLNSLLNTK